jgi:hypothetical protein
MNKSWQEERKEISVWLSGYLAMVKQWVDKVLNSDEHDVNKNKIVDVLNDWIQYLTEEREKIMKMTNIPSTPKQEDVDE